MGILESLTGAPEQDIHAAAPIPERLKQRGKVAILTGDKVEDTEFFYPYYRLSEAGYEVDVITEEGGEFEGKHGTGLQHSKAIDEVNAEDYALLYLPGGKAPAALRENDAVIRFVQQFARSGKPIAALCHGPQVLLTAGVAKGKRLAAWPGIKDEVQEAGSVFVDEALVEDGQFITGRMPGDLHRHLSGVMKALQQGATSSTQRPYAA